MFTNTAILADYAIVLGRQLSAARMVDAPKAKKAHPEAWRQILGDL